MLIIEHINAQSLQSHLEEIEILINERHIDILCISETWLTSNVQNRFVSIPNFNIYRCDQGRGGGVCIYVREELKVTLVSTNLEKVMDIEEVWISVQCHKLPSFIVGCIYRHPHASVATFNHLLDVFRIICLRNKPVFILGDLNDNLLSPDNKLGKIIKNMKLSQLIDKPTRITPNSSTLLDVIITNKIDIVINSDVVPGTIADHDLITITINVSKPKRQPVTKTMRCLKNYNKNYFNNLLLDKTFVLNYIIHTDDVNAQVKIFTENFKECLDHCAPIVTKEIKRPYAPWINDDIKAVMKVRDNLQKSLKINRCNVALQKQYKIKKKQVKMLIQTGKNDYFRDKFNSCKGDMNTTWNIVRSIVPSNKRSSKQIKCDNVMNKAEEFNDFFASVGKKTYEKSQENIVNDGINNCEIYPLNCNNNSNPFRPQPVDIDTVILTIKQLKDTNSFGSDGIPFHFIKDSLPVIIFYITIIVNTSIVNGSFPNLWKHLHVISLFKGRDEEDVNNYRPIITTAHSYSLQNFIEYCR